MSEIFRLLTMLVSSFVGACIGFRVCLFFYEKKINEAEKRVEKIKKYLEK